MSITLVKGDIEISTNNNIAIVVANRFKNICIKVCLIVIKTIRCININYYNRFFIVMFIREVMSPVV